MDEATIERAHLIDDHETMRTKALSDLSLAKDLLHDALAAIDGGSPAVAREFVDRALSDVDRARGTLRDVNHR